MHACAGTLEFASRPWYSLPIRPSTLGYLQEIFMRSKLKLHDIVYFGRGDGMPIRGLWDLVLVIFCNITCFFVACAVFFVSSGAQCNYSNSPRAQEPH